MNVWYSSLKFIGIPILNNLTPTGPSLNTQMNEQEETIEHQSKKIRKKNAAALKNYDAQVDAHRAKKRPRSKRVSAPVSYPPPKEIKLKPCAHTISAHVERARILRARADTAKVLKQAEHHLRAALSLAQKKAMTGELAPEEDDLAMSAKNILALLLLQSGRNGEGSRNLHEMGYKFRLSSEVLRYPLPGAPAPAPSSSNDKNSQSQLSASVPSSTKYLRAVDGVLPPTLLDHMQTVFGKSSRFWHEHDYNPDTSAYFSYLHPLPLLAHANENKNNNPNDNNNNTRKAKGAGKLKLNIDALHSAPTSLDELIAHVWAVSAHFFPAVRKARYAEWWTHCRQHSSGHQLHFDSDNEGKDTAGKPCVQHPIISTVLYLTPTPERNTDDSAVVGGPTLVTTQKLGDNLADSGWLASPQENRLVMFDGRVLHGVVPGRGHIPKAASDRRVTFMIAFWEELSSQEDLEGKPGSSQPLPILRNGHTWTDMLTPRGGIVEETSASIRKGKRNKNKNKNKESSQDEDGDDDSSFNVGEWGPCNPKTAEPLPVSPVWRSVGRSTPVLFSDMEECPGYSECFHY